MSGTLTNQQKDEFRQLLLEIMDKDYPEPSKMKDYGYKMIAIAKSSKNKPRNTFVLIVNLKGLTCFKKLHLLL